MADSNYNSNDEIREERRENDKNRNMLYIVLGVVAVLVVVLAVVLSSNKDDEYTVGINYLNSRNYDAALVALRKIEPSDPNYVVAQSKINYITGVRLYNQNQHEEAKVYLSKVSPSDEFYNESRIILENISIGKSSTESIGSTSTGTVRVDTVQKVVEKTDVQTKTDTVYKTVEKSPDMEAGRAYASSLINIANKFNIEYSNSDATTSGDLSPVLTRLQQYRDELNSIRYTGKSTDTKLVNFKNTILKYMNNAISLVQSSTNTAKDPSRKDNTNQRMARNPLWDAVEKEMESIKQLYGI